MIKSVLQHQKLHFLLQNKQIQFRYYFASYSQLRMVEFNLLQPKFRSRFKQLVGLKRSHTIENSQSASPHKTLAEISERVRSQQKNKEIHNMPKQSFIINKKQLLLSRKLFYKPKSQDITLLKLQHMKKHNKMNIYQDLMDQPIQQQQDLFNIHKEILNNPMDFHRNMIVKVKDDQQTKGILKQWYKANVSPNRIKLRSITDMEKSSSFSPPSSKQSIVQEVEKDKKKQEAPASIFTRKQKSNMFINDRLRNCKSNANQSILKRNLSFQEEDKEQTSQNTQKLAKLIVRVQPFWDKVRIKI